MADLSPSQAQTGLTADYFQFEADFVGGLQCIPMLVRMKLDNCGVKLKLAHWNQFALNDRQKLVDLPCQNQEQRQNYREWLQKLIISKTGQPAKELAIDPHPPWLDETKIPPSVCAKAESANVTLSLEQWLGLSPPQRFALIKLSRPSHENQNFLPALQEFGIIAAD
ncbi:MAG: nitrate reductase associated protein [Cyanobacteria bacterium J06623_7]